MVRSELHLVLQVIQTHIFAESFALQYNHIFISKLYEYKQQFARQGDTPLED